MSTNKKIEIFIGLLYSILTLMLILLGFVYTVSFLGAAISGLMAYIAFRGDNVNNKFAKLKKGFRLRKSAKHI